MSDSLLRDASGSVQHDQSCNNVFTWKNMMRAKTTKQVMAEVVEDNEQGTALKKTLSVWDVIAYGVGSTVGAGIFVITGKGALSAGPAVTLSFLLASISCIFSAFAYCEFAARVPVSGSAYTFTYVCLGEIAAWFIGWNLTLEYAISAAAVARGWSSNLLVFLDHIGANTPQWLNSYEVNLGGGVSTSVSFLSLLICIACMIILLIGVKESASFNLFVTVMNICIILFIIILGSFHIDRDNYSAAAPPSQTPAGCNSGDGSYTPCGINGVITGAAQVFFAYIGFDSVTTLAEEVKNPKRDLPIGIIGTLSISTSLYVGACTVVTGMVKWYEIDSNAPLAVAFTQVGISWASTLIAAVSVTGLTATTLTSLFGQPRIFYRMSRDGLLFKPFGYLHPTTQTPIVGTIVTGVAAGLISFTLPLDSLANMISIGTLFAFSTVCAGIVMLRYQPITPQQQDDVDVANVAASSPYTYNSIEPSQSFSQSLIKRIDHNPITWLSIYAILCLLFCACLRNLDTTPLGLTIVAGLVCVPPVIRLWFLPTNIANTPQGFVCPWVPFLPCAGIFCNMYLIASLDWLSYVRVAVWTIVGLSIYFAYGIRHSRLSQPANSNNLIVDGGHYVEDRDDEQANLVKIEQ